MAALTGRLNRSDIPSVADLRSQSAAAKPDSRWWYRGFRLFSAYVTWGLLHTSITPNQVTVASLLAAVSGLVLLGVAPVGLAIVGLGALALYHLLDRVDGEVARARRLFSLRGIYLDNSGHFLTEAGIFVALAFRMSSTVPNPRVLSLVGALGAVAAALARMAKHAPFQLYSQYVMERPSLVPDPSPVRAEMTRQDTRSEREVGTKVRTPLGLARGLALTWTSFPATLLVFAVGLGVEAVYGRTDVVVWALVGSAVMRVVVYAAVEVANLTGNLATETRRLDNLR